MRFCRLRSFAYKIYYVIFKILLDKYKLLWYNPIKIKKEIHIVLKNVDGNSVFAKVPFGVIQASNKINQYLLPTYLYLAVNKNIFGEVKTSIRSIREEYINTANRAYWHEDEFYEALIILTSNIVDEESNSIIDNLIDIKNLEHLSQMELRCNNSADSSNFDEQVKNLIKEFDDEIDYPLKKKDMIISINSFQTGKGFVKCSYQEYNLFREFQSFLKKNNSRISICQAMNTYYTIKFIIRRNEALINLGLAKKNCSDQVSKSLLKKECCFADNTAKCVLQILKSMNLIEVFNNPKKENDYYIKLNKNINESETQQ